MGEKVKGKGNRQDAENRQGAEEGQEKGGSGCVATWIQACTSQTYC